jgi:hypothetical protein
MKGPDLTGDSRNTLDGILQRNVQGELKDFSNRRLKKNEREK